MNLVLFQSHEAPNLFNLDWGDKIPEEYTIHQEYIHGSESPLFNPHQVITLTDKSVFNLTGNVKLEGCYISEGYFHESLNDLSNNFKDCGGYLNIYEGDSSTIFKSLISKHKIQRVYTSSEIGSKPIRDRDLVLEKLFNSYRIKWLVYQNNGVVGRLKNRDGWSEKWNKKMLSLIHI